MPRAYRKNEHIYYSMRKAPGRADFSDISLVHNCLPNCNLKDVSLKTAYMGRTFRSPLFINALTGGTKLALKINAALAEVARDCNLPMAVGSQMAALEDKTTEASYKIARRINPRGVIWANIGSYADEVMAGQAANMIRADGIQIHLNAPQELVMTGGDCRFRDMINRIEKIVKSTRVPVMVKEVGFGIAREEAVVLAQTGVAAIDIGGRGGTNFLEVENSRSGDPVSSELMNWGISTAISLIEVNSVVRGTLDILVSGGMYHALDIAKGLAIGAAAAGMAGYPIYLLLNKGKQALVNHIKKTEKELRLIMMMVGATTLKDLQATPLVITGKTAEWLQRRGIDPAVYANREKMAN